MSLVSLPIFPFINWFIESWRTFYCLFSIPSKPSCWNFYILAVVGSDLLDSCTHCPLLYHSWLYNSTVFSRSFAQFQTTIEAMIQLSSMQHPSN
jgi:hypothetical protein